MASQLGASFHDDGDGNDGVEDILNASEDILNASDDAEPSLRDEDEDTRSSSLHGAGTGGGRGRGDEEGGKPPSSPPSPSSDAAAGGTDPNCPSPDAGSRSQQRRRTIEAEVRAVLRRAETDDLEDGETFDGDAVAALVRAAHGVCYRRRYYDAIRDHFVVYPTVVGALRNYSLIEAAEGFYAEAAAGGEGGELPLAFTAALRAAAEHVAAEGGGTDQDGGEDVDEEYMDRLASTVHSRSSSSQRGSGGRGPSPDASAPLSPSVGRGSRHSGGDAIPEGSSISQDSFYGDASETIDQLLMAEGQGKRQLEDDPVLLGPLIADRDDSHGSEDDEMLFFEAVEHDTTILLDDGGSGGQRSPSTAAKDNSERSHSQPSQPVAEEGVTASEQELFPGAKNFDGGRGNDEMMGKEKVDCNEEDEAVLEREHSENAATGFGKADTRVHNDGLEMSQNEVVALRPSKNSKRVVVLTSNKEDSNQGRAISILRAEGIEPDVADAVGNPVLRNELFAVSGIRGKYPQVFLMDPVDGDTVFLGDIDTIQELHDAGSLEAALSSGKQETAPAPGNSTEGTSSHSFAFPSRSEGLEDSNTVDDDIEEGSFSSSSTTLHTPTSQHDDPDGVDANNEVNPEVISAEEVEQVRDVAKYSNRVVELIPPVSTPMHLVKEGRTEQDDLTYSNPVRVPIAAADLPPDHLAAGGTSEHSAGAPHSKSYNVPISKATDEHGRNLVVDSDEAHLRAMDSSSVSMAPRASSAAERKTEKLREPVSVVGEFLEASTSTASSRPSIKIDAFKQDSRDIPSVSSSSHARTDAPEEPDSLNTVLMATPSSMGSKEGISRDTASSKPLLPHHLVKTPSDQKSGQKAPNTDVPVKDESEPVAVVASEGTKVGIRRAAGSIQSQKSSSTNTDSQMQANPQNLSIVRNTQGDSLTRPHPHGFGVVENIDAGHLKQENSESEEQCSEINNEAADSGGATPFDSNQGNKQRATHDPYETLTQEQPTPPKHRGFDPFDPLHRTQTVWEPPVVARPVHIRTSNTDKTQAAQQGRPPYETPLNSASTPPRRLSADDELELARLEALLQVPPSPRQFPLNVSTETNEFNQSRNPELERLEDLLMNSPPPRVPDKGSRLQQIAPEGNATEVRHSNDPTSPTTSLFRSYLPSTLAPTSVLSAVEDGPTHSLPDTFEATSDTSDQRSVSQDGEDEINDDDIGGNAMPLSASSDDDLGDDYERLVADAKKQLEELENEMRELREMSKTYDSEEDVPSCDKIDGVALKETPEGRLNVDQGDANDAENKESTFYGERNVNKEIADVNTQGRGQEPPSAEEVQGLQKAPPDGKPDLSKKRKSEKEKKKPGKKNSRKGKKNQVHPERVVDEDTGNTEATERRSNRSFSVDNGDEDLTPNDRAVSNPSAATVDPDGDDSGLVRVNDPPSVVQGIAEEIATDTKGSSKDQQRRQKTPSSNRERKKGDKKRGKRNMDDEPASELAKATGRDFVEYEANLRADDGSADDYEFRKEEGIENEKYFEANEAIEDTDDNAYQRSRGTPVAASTPMARGNADDDDIQVSVVKEDIDMHTIDRADSIPRDLDLEAAERRRKKEEAWDEIPCNWCCRNLPHTWVIATTMIYRLDRAKRKERGTVKGSSRPS